MNNIGNINISLDNTTPVVCEECGNNVFLEGVYLRKISGLLIGRTKDGVIPFGTTLVCSKCGHINEDFKVNFEEKKEENGIIIE